MAVLGGCLMILGGIGDLTIRRLLPGHLEFLAYGPGDVPAATETLLLAMLHALGAALIASGLAVLLLLQQAGRTGDHLPALGAVAVALLAEGMNAAGMYRIGSRLYPGPLACMLLVTAGVALFVLPRRTRRTSGNHLPTTAAVLCVLLVLGGCRTGGGWTPADPAAMERLPMQSTGRWGSTTAMRFGDYSADSVKVGWARGSGHGVQLGSFGGDHAGSRHEYRFSLERPNGARMSVRCHSSMSEQSVGFRGIEFQTSARYTYDCSIHVLNGSTWKLALIEERDGGFAGTLTTDGTRLDVHTKVAGNRVTGRRAEAYELHDDDAVFAALNPRTHVVWLPRRGATDGHRDAAAAVAVALLLYQRPTD